MTIETQTTKPTMTKPRRWIRFRLRTLLILVTVLSVPLGWVGWELDQRRREKATIAWVEKMDGGVYFRSSFRTDERNWWEKTTDRWLGERVHTVMLDSTQVIVLSPLTELKNLNELLLINTKVTDLSPLTELEKLRSLRLTGTQVSDLSPLADLKNLKYLDLINTPVTDLSSLAGLNKLSAIFLNHTQVSDLSPLAELKNLNELHLDDTQVSDLSPLVELKNLKMLRLGITEVSEEQVQALRLALPNCKCWID